MAVSTSLKGQNASAGPSSTRGQPLGSTSKTKTIPGSDSTDTRPELPWAFIDCPQETLIVLITHMLNMLIQHNDQVVLTPDALTRFHSRAAPGISVEEYLKRIVRYTNMETIPLLSLLAYIDTTCQNLPTFTLSSLTVHRFLIAGVCVGSKAQCDVFCTNAHYAKVGGIKTNELNALEREFLKLTQWTLTCNAELLQRYYTSLIRSHGGYKQASEPTSSPFMSFDPAQNKEAADDDLDAEMKSTGYEELSADMVATGTQSRDKTAEPEPTLPSSSQGGNAEADASGAGNEDVSMADDRPQSSRDPQGSQMQLRQSQMGDMDVDPVEDSRDATLDSPRSMASSSVPSSSRSSLRTTRSQRGRAFSISSAPKLAEPRLDKASATAPTSAASSTPGQNQAVSSASSSIRPEVTTIFSAPSVPSAPRPIPDPIQSNSHDHPDHHSSHSFKHFVGGIFRRKHGHGDSEERDTTPPKDQGGHHGIFSSFRHHSKSHSPAPEGPEHTTSSAHQPSTISTKAVRRVPSQPPPEPSPPPKTPEYRVRSNTPPDQIPSDLTVAAVPSQVMDQLLTPIGRSSKRMASVVDQEEDDERMTKSPRIDGRSPSLRSDRILASPRLNTRAATGTKPLNRAPTTRRSTATTGEEANGDF
ncbi:cyclin-domain-containing protein [Kockovaella imperatae]|uniref:Cyclin-domain-containing protein n=1 Tax=Kockovaella imperatae TaxID=4999 RepID=A0A1Y1U7Q7_9TREE|nr:cyclin-domain-containing protein [Kockovaella imperatae]ORX33556.1 cyclin-domain-containing protein [Kockovaella imperatae]